MNPPRRAAEMGFLLWDESSPASSASSALLPHLLPLLRWWTCTVRQVVMWASTAPQASTSGGDSTRGADSSHSATTILMAGRDFKMFFLGVTTLHNKNEFRTNAAVRKFVSTPRNCQTFRASHKRTGAQPQFCSCSFWQTLEHQNALGQCKMFCGSSRFAAFIKIQY